MRKILCVLIAGAALATAGWAAKVEYEPVPAIAILYFDNATGVEHLAWMPKGFADLLIRDVQSAGKIKVSPRRRIEEASRVYRDIKGSAFSNRALAVRMGKFLGVTHVVAGRFTRRDTDLVIEIKIIETEHARQSGWRQIDGPSDDLMYLEKQAALKIFEILKIDLGDRAMVDLLQIPTTSVKALAYYSMALDARDREDREEARVNFQAALNADRYFRPAAEAISGMAFVLSGKAILRATVEETAVIGTAGIRSVSDLIEIARTNAVDFTIGEPVAVPVEGETLTIGVKVPLQLSVRPDFVNLWLYSIRRLGREMQRQEPSLQLTIARTDLFDNPLVLSLPQPLAQEWLDAWSGLKMRLIFQGADGRTLFETPHVPILPLYIGNAEGQFPGIPHVYGQVETAYEVERVPKQFFDEPLQVSLEIVR